jgi:hypothetical protein
MVLAWLLITLVLAVVLFMALSLVGRPSLLHAVAIGVASGAASWWVVRRGRTRRKLSA